MRSNFILISYFLKGYLNFHIKNNNMCNIDLMIMLEYTKKF